MSDGPAKGGDGSTAEARGDPSDGDAAVDDERSVEETTASVTDADVWRYLRLGAVGLLALLVLISTIQLYTNASAAIGRWVAPDYVPVFQVAFNLVVLLLSLAGLAMVARRRGQSPGSE